MYKRLFIDATQPLGTALENIVLLFYQSGWEIVEQTPTEATLRSPQPSTGARLRIKFIVSSGERTSSEPTGNYLWGLHIALARRDASDTTYHPEMATTIFHGGYYDFIINDYSFIIVPPETQTHRFQFGTWCTLLQPVSTHGLSQHPTLQGEYTPFLFMGDRSIGSLARNFPHIQNHHPVYLIQYPNGSVSNTVYVAHISIGRKFLFQREYNTILSPFILLDNEGGVMLPLMSAPAWWVEAIPTRPTYLPTASSLLLRDFLVPRVLVNARGLACGELPPDGARLISLI